MDACLLVTPAVSEGAFTIMGYNGPGDFVLEGIRLRYPRPGESPRYVYSGLQILSPDFISGLEWNSDQPVPVPLRDHYRRLSERGRLGGVLMSEGEWFHITTLNAYHTIMQRVV